MAKKKYKIKIADTQYWRDMVKCQAGCPVNTDARAYVTAMARGEIELGYEISHDPNPLSTACGRICGAPCETACRRGDIGPDFEPIAIRPIKRVLTERYGPESVQRLPGRVESTDIIPLDTVSEMPAGVFSRKNRLNAENGTRPGTGPEQVYSASRWSRRELQRLADQPGRIKGKVAIIGAGPAGLTAAHDMASLGHQVTIFEAGPKTGGMMRYGVPIYRIDQQVMDLENDSILEMEGVEIRFNTPIGDKIKLADLRRDYDAVFLGMGLQKGRMLNIEGSDLDGVVVAVDLLLNYNMGYKVPLGRKVLVVGGGDVAMDAARTAMRLGQPSAEQDAALADTGSLDEESETIRTAFDVARTALRLGAFEVRMISLESAEELPASDFEVEEALEEGIQLIHRKGPNRIVGKDGKVTGLEVIDVESVFDAEGRFSPKFKAGSEQVWACDTLILAIGQSADLGALGGADDVEITPRGLVKVNPENGQTTAPDIFAGGDVAYGPRLIIDAVRHGHVASLGMEAYIQGKKLTYKVETEWQELPNHVMFENWTKLERRPVPSLPVNRRTGVTVIDLGYSEAEGAEQGSRCLECSVNTIFDGSLCILCNACVDICPWDCLKIVSLEQIEGDGTFAKVVEAQLGASLDSYLGEERKTVAAMLKDDEACTRCALCADRCPTHAITMESFRFNERLSYVEE